MCGIRPVDEPGQRGPGAGRMFNHGGRHGVQSSLDNNQFEPVYTGWQTEYRGFYPGHRFLDSHGPAHKPGPEAEPGLTEHLEDQVQKRTRELHAVLDERKAFFSDLAHNLKAPWWPFTDLQI